MKIWVSTLFAIHFITASIYAETIEAELGTTEAWVGEGVSLYLTLKAEGPFSGTASFDLPELAHTFFIKQGNPTVGSQVLGGETWMTQRHEFKLYTQQSGRVEVPAIRVWYEAKKDFVSEAVPHSGETAVLIFESKKPPGTENLSLVVAAQEMRIEQSFLPAVTNALLPGDVIERKIIRRAQQTTGMIFPAPTPSAPNGVRVYSSRPEIGDEIQRGITTVHRLDAIKYQFTEGGSYLLPALKFVWWDPAEEQLKSKMLEGALVTVKSLDANPEGGFAWKWFWPLLPLLVVYPVISKVWKDRHRPEHMAIQAVLSACRAPDPAAAYAAVLRWETRPFSPGFLAEWTKLSKVVFGGGSADWDGNVFAKKFVQEVKRVRSEQRYCSSHEQLPPLNPGSLN